GLRAHLGPRGGAVLAGGDATRPPTRAGILLHGGSLLGPGVDAAAAGLRLHLRQTAVRPPARRPPPAGARASPRRARLPGQDGSLSRDPRRAARRGDVPAGRAPSGRGHHVPVARTAVLSSGTIRGTTGAHLPASVSRSVRAAGPGAGTLLRPAARRRA